jgi:hypothetical protein
VDTNHVDRLRSIRILDARSGVPGWRRRTWGLRSIVLAILVATVLPLHAHHGSASFDTTKELTLKGTVTEWIWANPHCFLKFDAKDDTGTVRNWAAEVSNPTDMARRGWARTSFKVGEQVTVVVQPVKSGDPIGRIRSVTLANGQVLSNTGPAPAPASAQAEPGAGN